PSLNPLYPQPTLFPYTTLFRSIDAVRRTRRRAQKARHTLLEPVLIALQHVHAAIALLELGRLVGIILGHRGLHHLLESDTHSLGDRKSTRLNSSHGSISYAVFC